MKNTIVLLAICVAAASGITGCSSTSLLKTSSSVLSAPKSMIEAVRAPKPVGKILCLWEPAEGQGLDEKPARGFAGQIMFFAYGEASPVKVKGKVRIFEYTHYEPDDEDPTPAHTFHFDSGAWTAHHVEGTLGHSYNVFLPYVEKNKGHVVCALRVEIETEGGRVVSSPYTEVTLAAKTSHRPASAMQRNIVTRTSTGTNPRTGSEVTPNKPESRKLETMTISLPARK